MEYLSRLEAWSDPALTWWVLYSRIRAGVSVLLCCLRLGVLGLFLLKHDTNAPYYLPTFTKPVLSELF